MKTWLQRTVACLMLGVSSETLAQTVRIAKVGQWPEQPLGDVSAIALSGDHAYVATGTAGLRVIDISIPAQPVQTGFVDAKVENILVSGSYAYVVFRGGSSFWVIDVSDPVNPAVAGGANTSFAPQSANVSHNTALVTYERHAPGNFDLIRSWIGFDIFDISDMGSPLPVGRYEYVASGPPYYCRAVAISDSFAYLASYDLWVIDISNLTSPMLVGQLGIFDYIKAIVVSGNSLYALSTHLRVIDISNRTSPVLVGGLHIGLTSSLAVQGNHAYVGTSSGLRVFDVSNPSKPVFVGGFGTNAVAGVAVRDDYIYTVGTDLQILRMEVLPELGVQLSGGNLQIHWPTNVGNYLLESTTSLTAPQWDTVTVPAGISNGFHRVTVPTTNSAAYFRLRSDENP